MLNQVLPTSLSLNIHEGLSRFIRVNLRHISARMVITRGLEVHTVRDVLSCSLFLLHLGEALKDCFCLEILLERPHIY